MNASTPATDATLADIVAAAVREALRVPSLPGKILFDSKEAAEIVGLPQSWLEREAAAGRIPSCVIGEKPYRRWSFEHLQAIAAAGYRPPTSGPMGVAQRRAARTNRAA